MIGHGHHLFYCIVLKDSIILNISLELIHSFKIPFVSLCNKNYYYYLTDFQNCKEIEIKPIVLQLFTTKQSSQSYITLG